jgi:hypothetical protein
MHWPYEQARAYAGTAAALRHTDPGAAETFRANAVTAFTAIGLDPDATYAVTNPPSRQRTG